VQAWHGRTVTITLADATTGGPSYTITANGRWGQSNANGGNPEFEFSAKHATIMDISGAVVCQNGGVVAGGGTTFSAVAETNFPKRCTVLPGLQFIQIEPDPAAGGWTARIWQQR
jgi:hypothetical protein